MTEKNTKSLKEHTYYVKGMHCASCEIFIEKELLNLPVIKSVEARANKGEAVVEYEGEKPSTEKLNQIFKKSGYVFFNKKVPERNQLKKGDFWPVVGLALLIIIGFIGLNKLGLSGLVSVNAQSSLPMFFIFGLLAGISTCAALVGGLVLSLSKQWQSLYSDKASTGQRIQPHLMFNAGRLVSYAVFGSVLGAIGSKLRLSLTLSSILVMLVSVIMIILALQMLGAKAFFRGFQLSMPRFLTHFVADENNFKGKYMPFLLGASTFFLPCGFTITAQGFALISGNAIQGGLIMLFFALGTLPMLLAIGFSSVKFSIKPHLSSRFLKVAGILVLFFALFNINSQLNILGLPSLSDALAKPNSSSIKNNNTPTEDKGLPAIINGQQVIKMAASSQGYNPNYFKVRAGVPVRWEINDTGTSGCTNAVICRGLFDGQIDLVNGQISVKEFTPEKPGEYKFSCWMGMISGVIEVVDQNGSSGTSSKINANVPSAGSTGSFCSANASGCGCGGSGSSGNTE